MYFKILSFLFCSVVLIEGAFVDTLAKCSKKDNPCFVKLIQKVMNDLAKDGAPELDIPPIDPVTVKDIKVSILNVVDMVFVEGVVKGARKCQVNKFSPNFDTQVAILDLTCDISVKGKYKVHSNSPMIKDFFGGDEIHGDGNGKVKIEKLNMKIELPYEVQKKGDDVYLTAEKNKIKYTFDVLGKVVFAADSLYLGDKESSQAIVALMNQNWKLIMTSFGKNFIDVAIDFIYDFTQRFFRNVSAHHYIIEKFD